MYYLGHATRGKACNFDYYENVLFVHPETAISVQQLIFSLLQHHNLCLLLLICIYVYIVYTNCMAY